MKRKIPNKTSESHAAEKSAGFHFLDGGGKMAELIRSKDWSKTALGPIEQWPQSLRSSLSVCLQSRFPTALYWGPDMIVLYNDAWSPIPGDKHPWALGRPGCEVWSEIWDVLDPMFSSVIATGEAVVAHDALLPMLRHGFVEECYFDYNCSPIRDENGKIVGIFNVASEVTSRLIAERRTQLLTELTAKTAEVLSAEKVCASAIEILKKAQNDMPFVLIYLFEKDETVARLHAAWGIGANSPAYISRIDTAKPHSDVWSFAQLAETGDEQHFEDITKLFNGSIAELWHEPIRRAVVAPIKQPKSGHLYGAMVAGLSPRLAQTEEYTSFIKQVAQTIADAKGRAIDNAEHRELIRREHEAQQQLSRALSIGAVGTWMWNVSDNVLTADESLARLFGVDPYLAAKGLALETFTNSIHPADRDRVLKRIQTAVASDGNFEDEYRTLAADGHEYWVMARGRVEKENDTVWFPGLLVDITKRKRAEAAVNASEEKLNFMAESVPQKIFMCEPDGKNSYLNPQWAEFTGLSLEQVQSAGWYELIHPEDRPECLRQWDHSLKTGEDFEIEQRFKDAGGAYRWHLTRIKAMKDDDGVVTKWIGSSTDVSNQKQLEINLSFLSNASKALASSIDYEKTFQQVAWLMVPAVADWCVIDLYEGDNHWHEVTLAHKDPKKVALARRLRKLMPHDINAPTGVPKVVRTGKIEFNPSITDEMLQTSIKDKKMLETVRRVGLSSSVTLPIIVDDETIGALSMVSAEQKRQFTESDIEMAEELAIRLSQSISNARHYASLQEQLKRRAVLEAELLQANAQLEQRVKDRTNQLAETNCELERSNQELQDFAYVASHDLQEPLRKIQAFGNLLEDEYGDTLGEGNDYLHRMRNAASRMSVLIEDLLAFSRVSTRAKPFTPVDLNAIAKEVVSDLEILLRNTGGKVTIGKLPTIEADALQMRQLLQNLIGNGLKFHQHEIPPALTIAAVKTSAKPGQPASWHITFKDNGIGFDEQYTDKIFAVFQRLHNRDKYEGTGIGLAVCRKITERHNGTINASSTLGKGATFTVTLPSKQP